MITLQISLLGPLAVTINHHTVAFRTDAERALLAYLASHQGTPQRRDTLAALLSPDRSDSDALTYLRNRLTRLRDALQDDGATPPWLTVDRKQIALRRGDDIAIDITHFEQQITAVETHPHRQLAGCPTCLALLDEAVALVRGEFLAGLNFPSEPWEGWLLAQREYLHQRALEALTLLRDAQIERGAWAAVLALAQRQLALEPWLEAAHRAAMTAHLQLGDRNAALAQYEHCVALLWEELGVEPEEATQQLRQQLSESSVGVLDKPATSDNLPLQSGRFFGREAEKTRLLQRLVDKTARLVTLVGAGGVGKTRLALEVGQALKAGFPDGIWFVALGQQIDEQIQKRNGEQIQIAIGEAAGLGQGEKQLTGDQVLAILRNKRLLLVLDNCEGVLDELGFIPGWLHRSPGVVILATSREPLNFAAEEVVQLDGLPTGDAAADGDILLAAEALFVERGQAARADFSVTPEDLPQVRQICRLVDGLPLGIALAAAWVRRRSLAQIIEAIGGSLDFLSTRLRDLEPRHRSIRAVFETSWEMLDAEEQAILAALAVFPASFSADAARAVAGAHLDDLDWLCEKSLLQQQHEAERYGMHSLVRQFAADKLADRKAEVAQAFVAYYFAYACNHQDAYGQLQPEWRNFSVAINKAHALEAWQSVLDFVQVLDEPWFRQVRFQEMRAGLTLALDAANALGDEAALAQTLLRLGEAALELNAYGEAETHLGRALDRYLHLEAGLGIAHAKYLLGRIKNERAQDGEALTLFTESRRIFEEEGDTLGVARNLNLMAVCHVKMHRDFQTAHAYLAQSAALQSQLTLSPSYVETLRNLARVKSRMDAYADAEQCLREALSVSRQLGDIGEYAAVLYEQTTFCKMQGEIDAALVLGQECLDNFRKLGSLRWEALVKTQLGLLQQANQNLAEGLALLNDGLQIFHELDDRYEQAYSYYYLSKLYTELDKPKQSLRANEEARRLNLELNDPHLHALLN